MVNFHFTKYESHFFRVFNETSFPFTRQTFLKKCIFPNNLITFRNDGGKLSSRQNLSTLIMEKCYLNFKYIRDIHGDQNSRTAFIKVYVARWNSI